MPEIMLTRRSLKSLALGAIAASSMGRVLARIDYREPENINNIKGRFEADGSSTLAPLTEAAIEDFARIVKGVRITNGVSGTGGGFERFARGETVIANASRPIKDAEAEACAANGVTWYRFDMAFDGITVAVSAENDFVDRLSTDELARIWSADGGITTWADVRSEWPAENIQLYGPGTASGTFDFFGDAILGDSDVRTDYTPSEDDNVLVQGVAGSAYALGYFGFSFYEENSEILKVVSIDAGNGAITPTRGTIADGQYSPLSRTLFIYVNAEAIQTRPEVAEFITYYAAVADNLAPEVGYIALPGEAEQETYDRVIDAISGVLMPDSEMVEREDQIEGTPAG